MSPDTGTCVNRRCIVIKSGEQFGCAIATSEKLGNNIRGSVSQIAAISIGHANRAFGFDATNWQ